nr:hypothetical protein [Hymenobacter qilianensis]
MKPGSHPGNVEAPSRCRPPCFPHREGALPDTAVGRPRVIGYACRAPLADHFQPAPVDGPRAGQPQHIVVNPGGGLRSPLVGVGSLLEHALPPAGVHLQGARLLRQARDHEALIAPVLIGRDQIGNPQLRGLPGGEPGRRPGSGEFGRPLGPGNDAAPLLRAAPRIGDPHRIRAGLADAQRGRGGPRTPLVGRGPCGRGRQLHRLAGPQQRVALDPQGGGEGRDHVVGRQLAPVGKGGPQRVQPGLLHDQGRGGSARAPVVGRPWARQGRQRDLPPGQSTVSPLIWAWIGAADPRSLTTQ